MNISLFYALNSLAFQSAWLDALIRFLAVDLIYIMILVAAIFILSHYRLYIIKDIPVIVRNKWKEISLLVLSPVIAWINASAIKILIHTPRPINFFPDTTRLLTLLSENGFAFPSGHATAISALAFAIYYKNKKFGYIFFLAAILIGLARIAGGVHFPIDILGGYVLGFIVAFLLKSR